MSEYKKHYEEDRPGIIERVKQRAKLTAITLASIAIALEAGNKIDSHEGTGKATEAIAPPSEDKSITVEASPHPDRADEAKLRALVAPLEAGAKNTVNSMLDSMGDRALGFAPNNVGTGLQNKGSRLEGKIPGGISEYYVNFDGETLHAVDNGAAGRNEFSFTLSPEVTKSLVDRQTANGEVDAAFL